MIGKPDLTPTPLDRITRITRTSLCQVLGGLLLRRGLWPVLAGVKVVPAGARGGAGPGGAPPGRRLRSGWFGAYQELAGK